MNNKIVNKYDSFSPMKPQDLRVLFSLLTQSNKSDRALAKGLGISNTSLSKRRKKLEKDGYIKEYTIIPDLHRMGIELIVFHFSSTPEVLTTSQLELARSFAKRYPEVLGLFEERSHEGTSWFGITAHKNYDDYMKLNKKWSEHVLSLDTKDYVYSNYTRHAFVFQTDKQPPIPFSFKNLELLFQSAKQMNPSNPSKDKEIKIKQ
jgi:DNA-binding Lrp family transcriptional regulator